jgi:hypothetical protein
MQIFELSCVCAVHDKPYVMRFEKQPNGKYRFTESIKAVGRSGRVGVTVVTLNRIPMGQIEEGFYGCAWCGTGGINHCIGKCNAYVCGGLIKGDTFHCRKSCGASWVGIPLQEISTETRAECLSAPRMNNQPAQSTGLVRTVPKAVVSLPWWRR